MSFTPESASLPAFEKLSSLSPEALSYFFKSHGHDVTLDSWLLSSLCPPTEQAQRLLRSARAAHSYVASERQQSLLVAWPMSVRTEASPSAWKWARGEAQNGLGMALGEAAASVQFCERPLSCADIHQAGPTELGCWLASLLCRQDPLLGRYPETLTGPAVWIGAVSVPLEYAGTLEALFFKMNSRISAMTRALAMRMEALAEEGHAKIRVFAPTALWNGPSVARIAHARLGLAQARQSKERWQVWRDGPALKFKGPTGELICEEFPEETSDDVLPLLSGWQVAPGWVS